ncbi:hypothetical protein [Streptomyces sp. NPDC089919]|uniref:hypothetical protein n=1 Tax=Streptomyces sp. NPDC089919 TaxID=3155188 RepID=UPI003447DC01
MGDNTRRRGQGRHRKPARPPGRHGGAGRVGVRIAALGLTATAGAALGTGQALAAETPDGPGTRAAAQGADPAAAAGPRQPPAYVYRGVQIQPEDFTPRYDPGKPFRLPTYVSSGTFLEANPGRAFTEGMVSRVTTDLSIQEHLAGGERNLSPYISTSESPVTAREFALGTGNFPATYAFERRIGPDGAPRTYAVSRGIVYTIKPEGMAYAEDMARQAGVAEKESVRTKLSQQEWVADRKIAPQNVQGYQVYERVAELDARGYPKKWSPAAESQGYFTVDGKTQLPAAEKAPGVLAAQAGASEPAGAGVEEGSSASCRVSRSVTSRGCGLTGEAGRGEEGRSGYAEERPPVSEEPGPRRYPAADEARGTVRPPVAAPEGEDPAGAYRRSAGSSRGVGLAGAGAGAMVGGQLNEKFLGPYLRTIDADSCTENSACWSTEVQNSFAERWFGLPESERTPQKAQDIADEFRAEFRERLSSAEAKGWSADRLQARRTDLAAVEGILDRLPEQAADGRIDAGGFAAGRDAASQYAGADPGADALVEQRQKAWEEHLTSHPDASPDDWSRSYDLGLTGNAYAYAPGSPWYRVPDQILRTFTPDSVMWNVFGVNSETRELRQARSFSQTLNETALRSPASDADAGPDTPKTVKREVADIKVESLTDPMNPLRQTGTTPPADPSDDETQEEATQEPEPEQQEQEQAQAPDQEEPELDQVQEQEQEQEQAAEEESPVQEAEPEQDQAWDEDTAAEIDDTASEETASDETYD